MENLVALTLFILKGTVLSLQVFAVTAIFSIPLGILVALARVSSVKLLRWAIDIYTWVFRGSPLMLQLFFTYYGLPVLGIKLSAFAAASITFILNYAAYFTEIFRAGIESIDKGQVEASRSLGMTYFQTMRHVVLPQALRRVLPPVSNEAITLVKDTALLTALGMGDMLRNAKQMVMKDFSIVPFFIATAIYLVLSAVIVLFFRWLERKYKYQ